MVLAGQSDGFGWCKTQNEAEPRTLILGSHEVLLPGGQTASATTTIS